MDHHRFDALTRALAAGLPRRGMLRKMAGGGIAAAAAIGAACRPAAARRSANVTQTAWCQCFGCADINCNCRFLPGGELTCSDDCCLYIPQNGIVGGGTVQLATGSEASIVVAATAVVADDGAPTGRGTGVLRWVDTSVDGQPTVIEAVGIRNYGPVRDLEGVRQVDGQVLVNGAGPYPFTLRLTDLGPASSSKDTVALAVGDAAEEGGAHGFSYAAEGNLLAGDLVGTWTLPEAPDPELPTS